MKAHALAALILFGGLATHAMAGEALVVKTADGKFVPAAASQWAEAGPGAFRFVLKTGLSAPQVAKELSAALAPIKVEAKDDLTLVFSGQGLTEADLLAKLAAHEITGESAMGDALAALSDLGSAGAPAMGDMSSAGSIRASKAIELPKADGERADDPANVIGEVIGFEPCQPVPIFHIQVLTAPTEGEHKASFKEGQKLAVRGYYAFKHGTKDIDKEDPRTQINLKSDQIKLGTKIFGKPFRKDGDEWVFETIEPVAR